MKKILFDYTQYNVWANARIISFAQELTQEQLNKQQASSFDSIRKTIDHIADCEYNWLKRIIGDTSWEAKSALFENIDAVAQFWHKQSNAFVSLIQEKDEAGLHKNFSYKNTKNISFANPFYEIIMHVMNHSTYHRGQIITLMRGAGFTNVASTDLITFYRR
jgi:uncharacterized damage-inducible protein DinB